MKRLACVVILVLVSITGCGEGPSAPLARRLVDDFSPAVVSGTPKDVPAPRQVVWRFDGPLGDKTEWEGVLGIRDLAVEGGRLRGETTNASPVLRIGPIPELDPTDLVHEIQVRMRIEGGRNIGVHLLSNPPQQIDPLILGGASFPWPNEAPVTAGEGLETFVVRPFFTMTGASIGGLLLKPADEPGARFEIESVRIVFRREHLASIPSGIGFHGMNEIYRESVVARSPESIRWEVELPERPRLSLSLATLDEHPVTFRVALRPDGGEPVELLRRTVSTPSEWDPASLELDDWSGRKVTLDLSLSSGQAGTLGVWGSPVIRRRGELPAGKRGQPRPQGVIVVLTDTLRSDRLDAYGHGRPTAPTVARMAVEGIRFNALSQASWTKVSVPSLLTSLYPLTSGVRDFPDRMPSSATTLAEVYRKAGYATLGFTTSVFAGRLSNMHQGYEETYERELSRPSGRKTARRFIGHLLGWLDEHRDEPFFVFVHWFDPHAPYKPEPPYDRLWTDAARMAKNDELRQAAAKLIRDPDRQNGRFISPAELRQAGADPDNFARADLDAYDGSIRGMDTELGRLFERLRELGIDDRTLVAFTSDHGEEFFEHGLPYHGQSLHGELTRVPLVIRYPDAVPARRVVDEPVGLVDVMPTLLALSGLETPPEAQGRNLLAAGTSRPRPVFGDRPAAPHFISPYPRALESFSVVHEGWKLIWNVRKPAGSALPEHELYDFKSDPLDRVNVAAKHPDVVKRLSGLIAAWRKDAAAKRLPSDEEGARGMSSEERARLRALGYIQ
jgi:arylsulfatase A-like enzyme